jgi:UDP-glucuronate 4-epimerase
VSQNYSIKIKNDRLKILKKYKNFVFKKISIENKKKLNIELNKFKPKKIYHLAAQAGVRYSFINPLLYYKSNLEGFFNVLDYCRKAKIEHLIFASTSSVYGNNNKFPLKETSPFTNKFVFKEASPKTDILYPAFESTTFLSIEVVSDKLYEYCPKRALTSMSDASIISTLVFVTI